MRRKKTIEKEREGVDEREKDKRERMSERKS